MDIKKTMRDAASSITNKAERQLREVERISKETGRPLGDKYYEQKARVNELKRKGF